MRIFEDTYVRKIYLKQYHNLIDELVKVRECLEDLYTKGLVSQDILDTMYDLECHASGLFWTE